MKKLFNFRLLVLIGVLITSFTTQVWGWTGYFAVGGDVAGGWSGSDTYRIQAEGSDGLGYFDIYMETNEKFCLYKNDGSGNWAQYGPTNTAMEVSDWGIGSGPASGYYQTSSYKFTGSNQVVRVCINRKHNGEGTDKQYYPGVSLQKHWDPKDDIQDVLNETKVMFYYGDTWNGSNGWKYLYTNSDHTGEVWSWMSCRKVNDVPVNGDEWDNVAWAAACLAPGRYYVSHSNSWGGCQMTENAEGGRSYLLNNGGGDNCKTGDNCSKATLTQVSYTVEYGEVSSVATSSYDDKSAIGKDNDVKYYTCPKDETNWTEFDESAAVTLAPGTYTVAAVVTDGVIYVKAATATLTVNETKYNVTINASMHGSATGCTTSPASGSTISNVGRYTSADISATAGNGCFFDQWSTTSGVTVGGTKTNPTTVKTAGSNGTVTAHFYTKWAIMGGHTDSHSGSSDDLGDWVDSYNDLVYVSNNSFIGKITLSAGTYKFKVYDRQNNTYWGCNTTISGYAEDYVFYSSGDNDKNCTLTISEAGEYIFAWNDADHKLTVIYPDNKAKAILKKNSIIYFDITTGNGSGNYWHNAAFTARFWFKTLAGKDYSSVDKASSTMVENWHYYAPVPDCDYIGRIQMNRMNPAGGMWNSAATVNIANSRTNDKQNCLVYNHDNASPTISWGTYCPPISTATLSNNGTTVWDGDGGSSNPYLVPTSSSIFVTTNITQPLEDGNMTQMYQFKDNGSNHGDESSISTHTFTASGTTGTKVPYTVTVRNNYNSTNGTSATSDAIYFEARTPYNIAYKPGAYGAEDAVTDVKLKGVSINLRGAIYTREGYTQTGWSATDGGVQSKALNIAYTTDEALELYPVWTAKTTTVTLDPNTASHGTGEDLVVTATYDNGTLTTFVAATPDDGYDLIGYFYGENKIVNADGSLVKNTDYTSNDESPVWKSEVENLTLLAHYEEHTYSITIDKGDHGAANGSGSVVFDAASATISTAVSANAGYSLAGYYDGELKVLNTDGSFANTNVAGYITSGKWSKNDGDATLTAKFNTVTLTFNSGLYWNSSSNWTPNCVPTIDHDVIIQKTCRITNQDAKAKSVKIDSYLEGGPRLYVEYGGGLVVAEGITAKHKSDGSYEHTTDLDLWIRTDDDNNSGLICGNASFNTEATYIFYSKVYRWESYYINQYVGIPYTTMSPYQWYGVYVFEYDDANDAWKNPDDGDLKPFTAYDIISKSSDETYTTFYTDGILNLPGISGDGRLKTLNCGWRAESPASIDKIDDHQDYLFANSWTAPISIEHITSGDYSNLVSTIYIFNAGYIPEKGDEKILGDLSGTWSSISFEASSYMDHKVIPATQAFMVTATNENAKLILDYKKHVYDPALSDGINNDPLKAPRRTQSTDAPTRLKMTVQIDTVKADILYLFEREDFTSSFDDGWDGYKIMGENFAPQLYAINGESQLAIDAVQDINGTEVGFKAGTRTNEYTFVFDYDDDEPLYLYDKDTQEFTQISNEATYTFTTNDTDEHARFIITRSNNPAVLTAIENSEVVIQAEKFFENGQLFIKRGERMYNATGELVK